MFPIRQANEQDIPRIKGLLQEVGVNDQGIEKAVQQFFVVERWDETEKDLSSDPEMVGVIGLEVHKPHGLLRSLVMKRGDWNAEVGLQLLRIVLAYAKKNQLSAVYMLVGQGGAFLEQLGFLRIKREDLPKEIQQAEHVKQSITAGIPMVYRYY